MKYSPLQDGIVETSTALCIIVIWRSCSCTYHTNLKHMHALINMDKKTALCSKDPTLKQYPQKPLQCTTHPCCAPHCPATTHPADISSTKHKPYKPLHWNVNVDQVTVVTYATPICPAVGFMASPLAWTQELQPECRLLASSTSALSSIPFVANHAALIICIPSPGPHMFFFVIDTY